MFDETYYVKDAWTLMHLGYESQWPTGADADFNAGIVDGYTNDGSFVVHPPLGKWMISLGLAVFGASDSVGWRISTALVGILAVALIIVIARSLFASPLLGTIAGFLMAIDGNAIVMSRVALLDNSLMFFVLLGFGAVLLDRHQSAGRLSAWLAARAGRGTDLGPALWNRPWLFAAGVAFGLACAVKWNGVYFLAAFAVYTLVVDALARRRAGITFWASGTLLKQGPVSFLLTVPVAAALFLASWTGWFVTDGGYYRHWSEEAGNAWQGVLAWVPHSLQSFWHYQAAAMAYHVGENPSARLAGEPADLAPHDPAHRDVLPRLGSRAVRMRGNPLRGTDHGCRQPADLVGRGRLGRIPAVPADSAPAMAGRAHPGRRRGRLSALAALPEPHGVPVLHDRLRAVPDPRPHLRHRSRARPSARPALAPTGRHPAGGGVPDLRHAHQRVLLSRFGPGCSSRRSSSICTTGCPAGADGCRPLERWT